MSKADVDVLFEVRNAFYLGNYQQCITEAQKVSGGGDEVKAWKEAFVYRAYIAQKKLSIPLDEIKPSAGPGLLMLRRYADYLANPRKRVGIVEEVEKAVTAGLASPEPLFFLAAALIYMGEGNCDSALRLLHQSDDLECSALTVQCLLKLDRVDLAMKEVKRMQEKDEDATLTQLATAWLNLAVGKDKLQDAFYIFQEMMDKYGETPLLHIAQSAALIQQEKYEEAEKCLSEALQRDANAPDALVNMIIVHQHLGKAPEKKLSIPLDEIKPSAGPGLLMLRRYADYLANPRKRVGIVEEVEKAVTAGLASPEPLFFLAAALIYMGEGNCD